jgi:hypothetical protein
VDFVRPEAALDLPPEASLASVASIASLASVASGASGASVASNAWNASKLEIHGRKR